MDNQDTLDLIGARPMNLISLVDEESVFPKVVIGLLLSLFSFVLFFTCVAKDESRSRSQVTPSVCPSVCSSIRPSICPSVCPKILSLQLLWNYWSNYHETWYVDRTSYVVMHISRKFWSPHFCGSYAPWNLEIAHKWPSETTDLIFMKLGM